MTSFWTGEETKIKLFICNSMIETVNSYTSVLKRRIGDVTLTRNVDGDDSSNVALKVSAGGDLPTDNKSYEVICMSGGHLDTNLNVVEQTIEELGIGQITYSKDRVLRGSFTPPKVIVADYTNGSLNYYYGVETKTFGTLLTAGGVADGTQGVYMFDRNDESIFVIYGSKVYSFPKVGKTDSNPVTGVSITGATPGLTGIKISENRYLLASPSILGNAIYFNIIDEDGNEVPDEVPDPFLIPTTQIFLSVLTVGVSLVSDGSGTIYAAINYGEWTIQDMNIRFMKSNTAGRSWEMIYSAGTNEAVEIGNPLLDIGFDPTSSRNGLGYRYPELYYDKINKEFILTVSGFVDNFTGTWDAGRRFIALKTTDFVNWKTIGYPIFKNNVAGTANHDVLGHSLLTAGDLGRRTKLIRYYDKLFAVASDEDGQYTCAFNNESDIYSLRYGDFWYNTESASGTDAILNYFDTIECDGVVYLACNINAADGFSIHVLGNMTNLPDTRPYQSAYFGYNSLPSVNYSYTATTTGSPTVANGDDGLTITGSSGNYVDYSKSGTVFTESYSEFLKAVAIVKPVTDSGPSDPTAQQWRIKVQDSPTNGRDVSIYISTQGIRIVDNNGTWDFTWSQTINDFVELLYVQDANNCRLYYREHGDPQKTWSLIATHSSLVGAALTRGMSFGLHADPLASSEAIWKAVMYSDWHDDIIGYDSATDYDLLGTMPLLPREIQLNIIDNILIETRGLDSVSGDKWSFGISSDFHPNNMLEKKSNYVYRTENTSSDQRITLFASDDDIGIYIFDTFLVLNTNVRILKIQANDSDNWTSPPFEHIIDFTMETGTITADAVRQDDDLLIFRCDGADWFHGELKGEYVILERIFEPLVATPGSGNYYNNVAFEILDNGPDYIEISTKGLYADEAHGGATPGDYLDMKVLAGENYAIYGTRMISMEHSAEHYRYLSILIEASASYSDPWTSDVQPSLPNERSWMIGEFDAGERIELTENASYPYDEEIDSETNDAMEINGQIDVDKKGIEHKTFTLQYDVQSDDDYENLVGIYRSMNENGKPFWYAPSATEFPNKIYLVTSQKSLDADKMLPDYQKTKLVLEEVK